MDRKPAAALPLYLQLAEEIAAKITAGELAPGARLPTHRDLAYRKGVTAATVSKAYAELQREGLIQATVGRGSFVRGAQSGMPPTGHADLRANRPPLRRFGPALIRGLGDGLDRIDEALFTHQSLLSDEQRHHQRAADWMQRHHGVPAGFEPVLCFSGQQALLCTLMATCRPGDLVATEEFTYIGFLMIARALGLRVAGIATDAGGLIPGALAELCAREKPRALFCTPTFNSPTTATLSITRRAEIAALARRHDLLLIEDDVYGALAAPGQPPLCALAPERGLLFTSFSKVAVPGLSAGIVAAPPALFARVLEQRVVTSGAAAGLIWEILAGWMETGFLDDTLTANRQEIAARNALAREALRGLAFAADPQCPHIWVALPRGTEPGAVVARLSARGVSLLGSDQFEVAPGRGRPALRISLSAARDRAELRHALALVSETLGAPTGFGRTLA